jgi:Domain of unknown function (DUF5668)
MNVEAKEAKERNKRVTAAVFGLILLGLGTLFLLDNLGVYDANRLRDYWPVLVIGLGLPGLIAPKDASDAPWGVVLAGAGIFFLLRNLDVIDWSFRDVWPLFLVLAGVTLIARSMAARRGRLPVGPDSPENGGSR